MRRRRGNTQEPGKRFETPSRPVLSVPPLIRVYPPRRVLIDLRPFEDRRQYHPLRKLREAGVLTRREARSIIERDRRSWEKRNRPSDFMPSFRLGFRIPDKVVRCVKRQRRKEVLFALRKTGKGSAAPRRRRDEYSEISCKR